LAGLFTLAHAVSRSGVAHRGLSATAGRGGGFARRRLLALAAALATLTAMAGEPGAETADGIAGEVSGQIFYTRYLGSPNLGRVAYSYDGDGFVLSGKTSLAALAGADGLAFAPDGDLIVGGQGNRIHKVRPDGTGSHRTVSAGGGGAYHVIMDPDGTRAWAMGTPGHLVEIPLDPFAAGVVRPLAGDEPAISAVAFGPGGRAYYTTGGDDGRGHFGIIDLRRFTTRRLQSDLSAAHHLVMDRHTGDLILFGGREILQIDPQRPNVIKSRRRFDIPSHFDQGAADGAGHLMVARVDGFLLFLDYASSGLVGDPDNFMANAFLDANLDDIAPLSGPGSLSAVRHGRGRRSPSEARTGSDATAGREPAGRQAATADHGARATGERDRTGGLPATASDRVAAAGAASSQPVGVGPGDGSGRPPAGSGSDHGGRAAAGDAGDSPNRQARPAGDRSGQTARGDGEPSGPSAINGAGRVSADSGSRNSGQGPAGNSEQAAPHGGGPPRAAASRSGAGDRRPGPSLLVQIATIILLALAGAAAQYFGGRHGWIAGWVIYAGGVASLRPGHTLIRYFEFVLTADGTDNRALGVPGPVEVGIVAATILAAGAWLAWRGRRRHLRSSAALADPAELLARLEGALTAGAVATDSRIGFVGRFSSGDGDRRTLILDAVYDRAAALSGGALISRPRHASLTPDQLAVLTNRQGLAPNPVIVDGPRDPAILRWLPAPLPAIRVLLGVPLVRQGDVIGLLGLANSPQGYDDDMVARARQHGDEIGSLLEQMTPAQSEDADNRIEGDDSPSSETEDGGKRPREPAMVATDARSGANSGWRIRRGR